MPCGTESGRAYDGRVGPRHRDLHAAQVVAAVLAQRHQVGDRLGRVVDVALEVDQRDVGPLRDLAHPRVAVVRREIVADRDALAVAGEDDPHVLRALAVRDLRLVGVEEDGVAAELGHARLEGVAGARRLVEEEHVERLAVEQPVRPARLAVGLQLQRDGERLLDLLHRPVDRLDVVLADERLLDCRAVGERGAFHVSSPFRTVRLAKSVDHRRHVVAERVEHRAGAAAARRTRAPWRGTRRASPRR